MLEEGGGGGATGLLNKGGGSNRLPGLVTKQQAVEFPQVYWLVNNYCFFMLHRQYNFTGQNSPCK